MTALVVALAFVSAIMAVLLVGLLRSHADILRALHDLGVTEEQLGGQRQPSRRPQGSADRFAMPAGGGVLEGMGDVHDITGIDPRGDAVHLGLEASNEPTLLAFLSSTCLTCQDFWRAFGTDEVRRLAGGSARVVIVTRGPDEEHPPTIAELAPAQQGVATVMSSDAWDDYGVPVTPYFVLMSGSQGVIAEGASATWGQVVELLEKALADSGIELGHGSDDRSRRELLTGRRREERADRALRDAGLDPYDPDVVEEPDTVGEERGAR